MPKQSHTISSIRKNKNRPGVGNTYYTVMKKKAAFVLSAVLLFTIGANAADTVPHTQVDIIVDAAVATWNFLLAIAGATGQ